MPTVRLAASVSATATTTIRNDASQGRGQIVRPVNHPAPQVEALDHECRHDWEARRSSLADDSGHLQ